MPSNLKKLTDENVWEVYNKCICKRDELNNIADEELVKVQGIINWYTFNRQALEQERKHILSLLSQVTYRIRHGMSIERVCYNKRQEIWTGSIQTIEALVCLGLAIGKVEYLLPRATWCLLKKKMPYVIMK